MNKHLRNFFTVLFVAAAMAACKKEDIQEGLSQINGKVMQGNISGVNGPTTGNTGEDLTFNLLSHKSQDGLWFDHLTDTTGGDNTRIIRLYNIIRTDSVAKDSTAHPISYTFKATEPGTYYLKFYKVANTDKSAIIDTVVIK